MRLISHRGNINGRIRELENLPDYIDAAINLGYDVEVDLWLEGEKFYLGHDGNMADQKIKKSLGTLQKHRGYEFLE